MTVVVPEPVEDPPVPAVALRTYRFLRLSVVGVIGLLAVSIFLESERTGWCLKGSISAYYYSPVRGVFVGALFGIGLVLVALWGKTAIEDSLFNLAGLLAPVVAFVPAKNDGQCPADPLTDLAGTPDEVARVLAANQAAIANTMRSYLTVVFVFLAVLVVIGIVARRTTRWPLIRDNQVGYWIPVGLASGLWLLGAWQFYLRNRTPGGASWFYQSVHFTSAITMFLLITLGIIWVGITRRLGRRRPFGTVTQPMLRWLVRMFHTCLGEIALSPERDLRWARAYIWQGVLMLVVAFVLFLPGALGKGPEEYVEHYVFIVEAWMIANVALFWSLQTKERWDDGAPPRTKAELKAAVETDAVRCEAEARAVQPKA